ncbi:MAG: FAD-dependent monooxygenase [Cytophagales bacterium]|nr:FAD-dependent monooxygenase [Bernardetiaceae bacterium]MDW8205223.1 FAD-dependent monooxygenase [Cytophagales bacterium]
MNFVQRMYDFVIIGGGLSGLTAALVLGKAGAKVVLLEKNAYPFHRVCGEYVSNEVLPLLSSLGIYPLKWGAVPISRLQVTSPKGTSLTLPLESGGFGVSRYLLDAQMAAMAAANGVEVIERCTVERITSAAISGFEAVSSKGQRWTARWAIAAHGKRSNLDKQLNRKFFAQRSPFVGVKYHVKIAHNQDLIALHNFEGGYCGISRIEADRCCLCYLVTRQQLKNHGSVAQLEAKILHKNPFLRAIFLQAEKLYDAPKVINEISFAAKTTVENGIFMCGDAAGMIAPLCGNGMAMAIHGGALLANLLLQCEAGKISREELYLQYFQTWQRLFATRLWVGRQIQHFFGSSLLSEALVASLRKLPSLAQWLIKQTHGKPIDY